MKKKLLFLFSFILTVTCYSQSILLVVDNNTDDTENTTFTNALSQTTYSSSVTVYNTVDQGEAPSLAFISSYDLVIWYCGDDSSINFWDDGKTGLTQLKTYLKDDGKLWLIGKDIIYNFYTAPYNFTTDDFLYNYVGLSSYNMQSYVDDGNTGAPQIDKTSELSNDFPSSISWVFDTIYYIDGVDVRDGGKELYTMGPSSYTSAGEVTMTHFENDDTNVIASFFNPAEIDISSGGPSGKNAAVNDLVDLIQATTDALINNTLNIESNNINQQTSFKILPNPIENDFNILLSNDKLLNKNFNIFSITGKKVFQGKLNNLQTSTNLESLSKGIYFLEIDGFTKKIVKL